jgi:TFIIF-interacting CTD phosphatase-like protein
VLDIDETLLHTEEGARPSRVTTCPHTVGRTFEFNLAGDSSYWVSERRGLAEFINFAHQYFSRVIIWSAGTHDYVHEVVRHIYRHSPYLPHRIFTRLDQTKHDGVAVKDLRVIFREVPSMGLHNTLILDDRVTNFVTNPHNGVRIPVFNPEGRQLVNDRDESLSALIKWLEQPEVRHCRDVRLLAKPYD